MPLTLMMRWAGEVTFIAAEQPRNSRGVMFAPLRSAEIWNPATERWTELPLSPTPRAWPSVVTIGGVVYQLSGTGDAEAAYRTIERLLVD